MPFVRAQVAALAAAQFAERVDPVGSHTASALNRDPGISPGERQL